VGNLAGQDSLTVDLAAGGLGCFTLFADPVALEAGLTTSIGLTGSGVIGAVKGVWGMSRSISPSVHLGLTWLPIAINFTPEALLISACLLFWKIFCPREFALPRSTVG